MVKYSFIIPVYNVKKYLEQCVESILSQTYHDYEIILVDDGSTDGSEMMCDKYAQTYECVTSVHQTNSGASVARNNGINRAKGEYILFLDSDDYWYLSDGLEKIDALTNNRPDIVCFGAKSYNEFTNKWSNDRYDYPEEMNHLSPIETLEYMVKNDRLNFHTAKRAYRKQFLLDNNLYFKPNIRTEDVEVGYRIVNCLPTYQFLNEKLYVYRQREGSVTRTIGYNHLREFAEIICTYAEFRYVNKRVKELMLSYTAYQYAIFLARISDRKDKESKELCKSMRKYTYLFRYRDYPRTKKIAQFYSIFGYRLTKTALRNYLKTRL